PLTLPPSESPMATASPDVSPELLEEARNALCAALAATVTKADAEEQLVKLIEEHHEALCALWRGAEHELDQRRLLMRAATKEDRDKFLRSVKAPKPPKAKGPPKLAPDHDRPGGRIVVGPDIFRVVDQAIDAIGDCDGTLYQHRGHLSHVVEDPITG